jgi:hypothetical protein
MCKRAVVTTLTPGLVLMMLPDMPMSEARSKGAYCTVAALFFKFAGMHAILTLLFLHRHN